MKPFTIAFPLYSSLDEAPRILMEKMHLDLSKKQVIIPGSPMFYSPILQGPAAALEALFAEHAPLSEEESKAISAHRSLLFLQFVAKSPEEFLSFLPVAKKLLENLASGIYVENSGCAWSAKVFLELVSGDVPLEAFVNFIETSDSLFTLGLEPFGLPDFCVAKENVVDGGREVLISAADSVLLDAQDFSSGSKWKDDDGNVFEFRNEATAPFAKKSPEWNAQGYRRLILRKS